MNHMDARYSIVLPYSGESPQLADSIRSVFAQSERAWELLLVEDGASSQCMELVRSIADDRVRTLGGNERRGLPARLNEAIAQATAPTVVRMDADDVMFPDRLQRLAAALATPTDDGRLPDVVGSRAVALTNDDKVRGLFKEPDLPHDPAGFLRSNAFTHPTVAGRADWFRKNPYREHLKRAQDKELWLRTHGYSVFVKLQEPLLFYRLPDVIRLALYWRSRRADREILAEYGPTAVGSGRTRIMLGKSWAKTALATALHGLPAFERRYSERLIEPTGRESAWQSQLAEVLCTEVPGWS